MTQIAEHPEQPEKQLQYELDGRGIKCPTCGQSRWIVLSTRPWQKSQVRRTRQCRYCQAIIATVEKPS